MKRVLVADDDRDRRELLTEILGGAYEVFAAANGRAALDLARTVRPNLVIVDVHLPEIDGVEVARRLRALGCVEFVMGFSGSTELELSALAVFDRFLLKPARPAEIRRAVHEVLALGRAG